MKNQPKIDVPVSIVEKMLDATALLFSAGAWLLAIWHYSGLPDQIPSHFNINGAVDSHGSKSFLFVLPAIAILSAVGIIYLSRFPEKFNHINKITPENAAYEYKRSRFLIRMVNVLTCALLFLLTWKIIAVAKGDVFNLGALIWAVLLALFVVPLLLFWGWPKKKN